MHELIVAPKAGRRTPIKRAFVSAWGEQKWRGQYTFEGSRLNQHL